MSCESTDTTAGGRLPQHPWPQRPGLSAARAGGGDRERPLVLSVTPGYPPAHTAGLPVTAPRPAVGRIVAAHPAVSECKEDAGTPGAGCDRDFGARLRRDNLRDGHAAYSDTVCASLVTERTSRCPSRHAHADNEPRDPLIKGRTRVDLFEYQARDLFAKHGVPVLAGEVIDTPEAAREATERLGGQAVVKAQVKVGGRGKAGGVKLAADPADAVGEGRRDILGMDIKGHTVHKVMLAQTADIAEEYYVSFLLDRTNRTFLAMASVEGGVEIEVVAEENPEALAKIPVDANDGVTAEKAREIVAAAKFPAEVADQVADVLQTLWNVFIEEDALLVEVNPLVKAADGKVIALDGKVSLDENADFRQPEHEALEDKAAANPLEAAAKAKNLNYVKLDGEVGIIGNGAGLVMSTLDVVAYAGEKHGGVKPANFLDIGGGASAEVMANGLEIILGDPDVKSVFVNVFGGITACDEVANGIVQALRTAQGPRARKSPSRWSCASTATTRSWVARSSRDANHPLVQRVDTMDGAADKAAELAAAK